MSEKRDLRCESCAWWTAPSSRSRNGVCRFNPPAPEFPETSRLDWCRQWAATTGLQTEWPVKLNKDHAPLTEAELEVILKPGPVVMAQGVKLPDDGMWMEYKGVMYKLEIPWDITTAKTGAVYPLKPGVRLEDIPAGADIMDYVVTIPPSPRYHHERIQVPYGDACPSCGAAAGEECHD